MQMRQFRLLAIITLIAFCILGALLADSVSRRTADIQQAMKSVESIVSSTRPQSSLHSEASFSNGTLTITITNISQVPLLVDEFDWQSVEPNVNIICIGNDGALMNRSKDLIYDRINIPLTNRGLELGIGGKRSITIDSKQLAKVYGLSQLPRWIMISIRLRAQPAVRTEKSKEYLITDLVGPIDAQP